jgi:hypothetical protein
MNPIPPKQTNPQLLGDIRQLIESSRAELASTVNSALTLLYWQIGQRIRTEVLQGERAEYGGQIVSTLAKKLEADHGRGFSGKNLRHMLRFAEAYPDVQIVSTLSRQLAWSHFLELIYLKEPLQRDFYTQMCAQERWSVRRLRERKDTLLFERTALSRQSEELLATDLKLGDFKAVDKGQVELYLRWLARHEQEPGEAPPLGIILCSGKKQEQIELLELDASGIHVAEYLTQLPPKALLQQKLHDAIARSRQRLENRGEDV